ncbi:hypothetical protein ACLOJK_018148 [Asimina triloba]
MTKSTFTGTPFTVPRWSTEHQYSAPSSSSPIKHNHGCHLPAVRPTLLRTPRRRQQLVDGKQRPAAHDAVRLSSNRRASPFLHARSSWFSSIDPQQPPSLHPDPTTGVSPSRPRVVPSTLPSATAAAVVSTISLFLSKTHLSIFCNKSAKPTFNTQIQLASNTLPPYRPIFVFHSTIQASKRDPHGHSPIRRATPLLAVNAQAGLQRPLSTIMLDAATIQPAIQPTEPSNPGNSMRPDHGQQRPHTLPPCNHLVFSVHHGHQQPRWPHNATVHDFGHSSPCAIEMETCQPKLGRNG